MIGTIFISHSRNDPNLKFFNDIFAGLKVQAIRLEFEKIIAPPWKFIKDATINSNSTFVLLSKYLLDSKFTQNWVSFEIGLASMQNRNVWVFEPIHEFIEFPVPYCTHYMIYDSSSDEHFDFIKAIIDSLGIYGGGIDVLCPYENCQIQFQLMIQINNIKCPACRQDIEIPIPPQIVVE